MGADDAVYMTDSGTLSADFLDGGRIVPNWAQLGLDGCVLRHEPAGVATTTLDTVTAFSGWRRLRPRWLIYVSGTMTSNVYRYRLEGGEVRRERGLFGNVRHPDFDAGGGVCGPDGTAFDAEGNLHVTVFGQGDVTVLDRGGEPVRRILTASSSSTNVAFGPRGSRQIHVGEDELGLMEVFAVGVNGLPLPGGPV